MSNVNGNNLFLSFVSINSESNVQETGKGNIHCGEREPKFRRKALCTASDGWKDRSTFLLNKYFFLCR